MFKVCLTEVVSISKHPNADALELATAYGFQVIVRKGTMHPGYKAFYIPVDSVLSSDLEAIVFGVDAKVKLSKGRVRQIRLRKLASQGMLISLDDVRKLLGERGLNVRFDFELEKDYSVLLGIVKYEPPLPAHLSTKGQQAKRDKPNVNTNFMKYNGLDNVRWLPKMFDGEEVVLQEKLHGTNCRFGIVPTQANTLLKKIKKFFRILPPVEKVYGSNNVELTNRIRKQSFYGEDVYAKAIKNCKGFEALDSFVVYCKKEAKYVLGVVLYGEVVGEGIQKNYDYGHKEPHFVLFDVKGLNSDGSQFWLSPEEVATAAKALNLDVVPTLYKGIYNEQLAKELTLGDSVYCPSQKVREGVVIKSVDNYSDERGNKRALKMISEDYLSDDKNTDFH